MQELAAVRQDVAQKLIESTSGQLAEVQKNKGSTLRTLDIIVIISL